MKTPPPKPGSPPIERRRGADRRVVDKGPPGRVDRRRGLEARKPEVSEIEMSNTDWVELTQQPIVPKKQ